MAQSDSDQPFSFKSGSTKDLRLKLLIVTGSMILSFAAIFAAALGSTNALSVSDPVVSSASCVMQKSADASQTFEMVPKRRSPSECPSSSTSISAKVKLKWAFRSASNQTIIGSLEEGPRSRPAIPAIARNLTFVECERALTMYHCQGP